MSLKSDLQELASPRHAQKLTPFTPPVISGEESALAWPDNLGASNESGDSALGPQSQPPEFMTVRFQADVERPKRYQGMPENVRTGRAFNLPGDIRHPKIASPKPSARMDERNELWIDIVFGGSTIDSVYVGRPSLDLTTAGGDHRTEAFFQFHYDLNGRHYGANQTSLIRANSDGSKEYLLQAVVNLPRNFIRARRENSREQEYIILTDGFIDLDFLSRTFRIEHPSLSDQLGMTGVEGGSSMSRLDYLIARHARRNNYNGYTLDEYYVLSDAIVTAIVPYIYAPGPKDFFKITVTHSGRIAGVTPLHEASLEDYLPFLTNLAAMQIAPVNNRRAPYSVFDFEIGREYRSKVDARVIDNEVEYTELTAKYRSTLTARVDEVGGLVEHGSPWIVPSDLQLRAYYRNKKLEINRDFGQYGGCAPRANCGYLTALQLNGHSVSGTLGEAGLTSGSYTVNCYGFVGFFDNNRFRLRDRIIGLGEDSDGPFAEIVNDRNFTYITHGDANSSWSAGAGSIPSTREKFRLM